MKATCLPPSSHGHPLLCTILRGEVLSRVQRNALLASPNFLAVLETQGVTSLVYHKLRRHHRDTSGAAAWTALSQQARQHAVESLLREKELQQVLGHLAAHGVYPLLLKGVPLGYTHYPSPEMRPCGDTDLLIRQRDRQRLDRVLRNLGYTPYPMPSGQFVMHQLTYAKAGLAGVWHVIDVHWKISNRQVFANCLCFDELAPEARPVPRLGSNACALAPVHALLHACLHRIAHQEHRDRLIWLYDIHLLAGRMASDEIGQFADLATKRQLRAVCWSGLNRAHHCFATPLPPALVSSLQSPQSRLNTEASAYFLIPRRRLWQVLFADLRALPGWRHRLSLIQEHLFPPAAYMVARYAPVHRVVLPLLYAYRLWRGLMRFWQAMRGGMQEN